MMQKNRIIRTRQASRAFLILILVILVSQVMSTGSTLAKLSPAQHRAFKENSLFVDVERSDLCTTPDNSNSDGSSTNPVSSTSNLADFVTAYGQSAFDIGKKNGIPYIAILAQAGIESGWGKSSLTVEANNFFGIKAGSGWDGPTWSGRTREERKDGSSYYTIAAFRKYGSPAEGFQGYADFIHKNGIYKEALKYPIDPVGYVTELKKAGYATDGQYIQTNVNVQKSVRKYIADHPELNLTKQEDVVPDTQTPTGSTTPTTSSSSCSSNGTLSGTGAQKVVEIARQELAKNPIGYDENVLKYTSGSTGAWCAWFVSWVYKESGKSFTGGEQGGWSYGRVSVLKSYIQSEYTYIEAGTGSPQPGDIVFYGRHVNLVVEVDRDKMKTIGGNEGGGTGRVKESGWVSTAKGSLAVNGGLEGFGRLYEN